MVTVVVELLSKDPTESFLKVADAIVEGLASHCKGGIVNGPFGSLYLSILGRLLGEVSFRYIDETE